MINLKVKRQPIQQSCQLMRMMAMRVLICMLMTSTRYTATTMLIQLFYRTFMTGINHDTARIS